MNYVVSFESINTYLNLIIGLIIFGLILFLSYRISKNKIVKITFLISFILSLVFYIFELNFALISLIIFLIPLLSTFFVDHSAQLYKFFKRGNTYNSYKQNAGKAQEEFYNTIEDAIISLSKTKTGALITFEKGENLDNFIKTGKKVDAPVSSELLRTIFYVGTPLHDGAVILRDNIIEAASCYYTPTTRAMEGKVGARHRAAIGFSETHSSITVVVSEETGRISFAINGELIHVHHENFKEKLIEVINQ